MQLRKGLRRFQKTAPVGELLHEMVSFLPGTQADAVLKAQPEAVAAAAAQQQQQQLQTAQSQPRS